MKMGVRAAMPAGALSDWTVTGDSTLSPGMSRKIPCLSNARPKS